MLQAVIAGIISSNIALHSRRTKHMHRSACHMHCHASTRLVIWFLPLQLVVLRQARCSTQIPMQLQAMERAVSPRAQMPTGMAAHGVRSCSHGCRPSWLWVPPGSCSHRCVCLSCVSNSCILTLSRYSADKIICWSVAMADDSTACLGMCHLGRAGSVFFPLPSLPSPAFQAMRMCLLREAGNRADTVHIHIQVL